MKVRLLSVGRDRSGLFEPGVQEYASRLAHYCRFELVELPDAKKARDPAAAIAQEAQTILAKLKPGEAVVALDERGKALTSRDLASWLGKLQGQGKDVCFVIGGAEGLGEEVKRRAALVLSLSAMTLPHRLARLVLAEQLYRAFTLLRGEPYHR
ncbi:MAG: 23S rRNA (pseudouridine(1915)-N(3))-methyltransferase RlmH [Deltaproteobacteria bacterium]|nr:23S rRNA (pseudouridine(1915)-N(3))-methyltransferase RlmH [Deltaproteobacteria bacterium]